MSDTTPQTTESAQRQVYFRLSRDEDRKMWQAFRDGNVTSALNLIITTHVAREHHAGQAERTAALADAAAWIAESIGYPVETRMPDHSMPQPLWDALVDHIHADRAGKWHGNTLDREDTESWLAEEAERRTPPEHAPTPAAVARATESAAVGGAGLEESA